MTGTDRSPLHEFNRNSSAEWRGMCLARHNVLLEGPVASTEAVLGLLEPNFRTPVARKGPRGRFDIPAGECGTLVLQEIATLSGDEQARLLRWLDVPGQGGQVVSTTTHPLFSLVARGLFDEGLYYRLNLILLHLQSSDRFGRRPPADPERAPSPGSLSSLLLP